MSNTYVIQVRGGKSKMPPSYYAGKDEEDIDRNKKFENEFVVEAELKALPATVWCGRRLDFKRQKGTGKYDAYTTPALKYYIFATFPAIYYPDVRAIDQVNELSLLSHRDIEGMPKVEDSKDIKDRPARPGLREFIKRINDEYAEAKKLEGNRKAICAYRKNQRLKAKDPDLEFYTLRFKEIIDSKKGPKVVAEIPDMPVLGGKVPTVELNPVDVRAAE